MLLAQPEVVRLLQKVIQPYAVTQLTIEAVYEALRPENVRASGAYVDIIRSERARLAAALGALSCVTRVWPSAANFLLVEFRDAAAAMASAHASGLLLRDFSRVPEMHQAVRISIGMPAQNDRLLASLS
jgi:histidinol-phosphate aminotransferase